MDMRCLLVAIFLAISAIQEENSQSGELFSFRNFPAVVAARSGGELAVVHARSRA